MKPCLTVITYLIASTLQVCVSPGVGGPAASQLTKDDIRQIIELARHRSDIKKPIFSIDANRPGEVHVLSGDLVGTFDPMTQFIARKKKGRWIIIESSVRTAPAWTTS